MERRSFESGEDRPQSANREPTGRVVVVGPYLRGRRVTPEGVAADAVRDFDARLGEAAGLARAIDLDIA